METNIDKAKLSILLEIDGKVHLVGISKERLEAIDTFVKSSVQMVRTTNKTQKDLRDFLGYRNDFPI